MCHCFTGMYDESAGREVQAAGSAGGSHAEGAEVSPTTEGKRQCTAAKTTIQSILDLKDEGNNTAATSINLNVH